MKVVLLSLGAGVQPLGEVEFIESDQMDLFGCAAGVCGV